MALIDYFRDRSKEIGRSLEELPVERIVPNPSQPRKTFDDESIQELARSIEKVGLIQPLVVRRSGGNYELISGERRLRAVESLGMDKVLCIVDRHTQDSDSALMAIIENLQREDLNFFEEAECYSMLISELGFTQEELAERIGKSQSFIANKLRLLRLEPQVREAIKRRGFSERHARALLKLGGFTERMEMIIKIGEGGLSVKATERLVDKRLNDNYDKGALGAKPRPVIVRLVKDYKIFMNTITLAIEQLRQSGVGAEMEKTERDDGVEILIRVDRF